MFSYSQSLAIKNSTMEIVEMSLFVEHKNVM